MVCGLPVQALALVVRPLATARNEAVAHRANPPFVTSRQPAHHHRGVLDEDEIVTPPLERRAEPPLVGKALEHPVHYGPHVLDAVVKPGTEELVHDEALAHHRNAVP